MKELLFEELQLNLTPRKEYKDLVKFDNIHPKHLFYNLSEQRQVNDLVRLLAKDKFTEVQQQLAFHGMRQGFAYLFYGAPGTGKTETAYQLARQTGRHILMVDIAKTKSMWFGESEKQIKEIFDRYRNCVNEYEIATTNLTQNLDKAFERRFLYKLEFQKPSLEARSLIWQSMLNGLLKENAEELAAHTTLAVGKLRILFVNALGFNLYLNMIV